MAGEILDRLTTFMGGRNDDGMFGTKPVFEEAMFDKMFNFITSLDPEQLSEEQSYDVMDIIEEIELEYEGVDESEEYDDLDDDLDEEILDEVAPKRVKRDRMARRKRSKAYRRNKSKRKMAVKRYRKSARGKQMAKKAKRNARRGKTATGRRIRKYR